MYVTNMCEEHGNRGTETNFIILDKMCDEHLWWTCEMGGVRGQKTSADNDDM